MKFYNLAGKKFGKLNVLRRNGSYFGQAAWLCDCECGKQVTAPSWRLMHGQTKSCGCLVHVSGQLRRKVGTAARSIFKNYKNGAKRRELVFELSFETFLKLSALVCFYCNRAPSNKWVAKSGESFIYNGIDRKNNNRGYTEENSVSCCGWCNIAKLDLSAKDFISNCVAVARRWPTNATGTFTEK